MRIQVLIDPVGPDHFRAYAGAPFPFIGEGASPYDAVESLRRLIQERLNAGAHLTSLDIPVQESPMAAFAGMWKEDDPLFAEWQKGIEEYRRKVDEDPDR